MLAMPGEDPNTAERSSQDAGEECSPFEEKIRCAQHVQRTRHCGALALIFYVCGVAMLCGGTLYVLFHRTEGGPFFGLFLEGSSLLLIMMGTVLHAYSTFALFDIFNRI